MDTKEDLIFTAKIAMAVILLFLLFLLVGCATPVNVPCEPQKVYIKVPVPCIEQTEPIPVKPTVHTLEELAAMPEYVATVLAVKEHDQLFIYAEKASVLIDGCR